MCPRFSTFFMQFTTKPVTYMKAGRLCWNLTTIHCFIQFKWLNNFGIQLHLNQNVVTMAWKCCSADQASESSCQCSSGVPLFSAVLIDGDRVRLISWWAHNIPDHIIHWGLCLFWPDPTLLYLKNIVLCVLCRRNNTLLIWDTRLRLRNRKLH